MPWRCAVTAWIVCIRTGYVLHSVVKATWLPSTLAHLSSSSLAYAVLKTCCTFSAIMNIATNNALSPWLGFFCVTEGSRDQVCQGQVTLQGNCGASPNVRIKANGVGLFCPHVHVSWLALIIRIQHFSLNSGNDLFFSPLCKLQNF